VNKCPSCGAELEVRVLGEMDVGMIAQPMMRYGMRRMPHAQRRLAQQRPLPPWVMGAMAGAMTEEVWDRERYRAPGRQPNVNADVEVPLQQAMITGAMIGVLGVFVALAGMYAWAWAWYAPLVWGVSTGVPSMVIAWFWLLVEQRRHLWRSEEFEREVDPATPPERFEVGGIRPRAAVEMAGHGWVVGPSGRDPEAIRRMQEAGGKVQQANAADEEGVDNLANCPTEVERDAWQYADRETWAEIARITVTLGENFSRPVLWREYRVMSQPKVRALQHWMVRREYLAPNADGSNGYQLTERGLDFLSAFIGQDTGGKEQDAESES